MKTNYNEILNKVELGLAWLDANARHAIGCQETFAYPAYDDSIRKSIKGTRKVRCYKICMEAIYCDFIMSLMRMYDSYERDTVCFKNLFDCLNDDFVKDFESQTQRTIKTTIQSARNDFKNLSGSHYLGRLKTVRHSMLAHTSINFNRNQIARYGDAEKLLEKTLDMLNKLNSAIRDKIEPYFGLCARTVNFKVEREVHKRPLIVRSRNGKKQVQKTKTFFEHRNNRRNNLRGQRSRKAAIDSLH